jgi:hypothetical protein
VARRYEAYRSASFARRTWATRDILLPWVAALTCLAAVLCCIGLGRPSLWIDEAHSYEFAALPSVWLVILNAAARDAYPPLYFLLLHFWMKLGDGEVWLRLSSVACHLASIPLIYLVGKRLLSPGTGLVAAALLAISPFHAGFATEVRMYAPMELLSLLSVWGMLVYTEEKSRRGFWTFTLAGLALLYMHVMGALLLVVQGVWLLLDRRMRKTFWKWALVLVAGFLPWAPLFVKAFVTTGGYGSEAPVHLLAYWFVATLGAGFAQPDWLIPASFATVLTLAIAGYFALREGILRRLVALWAFLPLLLELGANLAGKSVFGERTLIVSTPAWLILMAQALVTFPTSRAVIGAVLVAGVTGLGWAQYFIRDLPESPAHREAVKYIIANAKPGDAIIHSATVTYHPVHEYYLPRSGAQIKDFLIEPQGEFKGGKLGNLFRETWRRIRTRFDPAGAIKSGADPNRVDEKKFLEMGFRRVWYLRTTEDGMRRLWYLMPSRYYSLTADQVKTREFASNARLAGKYRGSQVVVSPGLVLELYR